MYTRHLLQLIYIYINYNVRRIIVELYTYCVFLIASAVRVNLLKTRNSYKTQILLATAEHM